MHDDWSQSRGMYLRVWPYHIYDHSLQPIFRWQRQDDRHELRVRLARRHADIPMNQLQYRIWDELRTDIALGQRPGDSVWTGITIDQQGEWCQQHAFFCVMLEHQMHEIISLHYDRWLIGGRRQEQHDYVDWTFNSRRMLDLLA